MCNKKGNLRQLRSNSWKLSNNMSKLATGRTAIQIGCLVYATIWRIRKPTIGKRRQMTVLGSNLEVMGAAWLPRESSNVRYLDVSVVSLLRTSMEARPTFVRTNVGASCRKVRRLQVIWHASRTAALVSGSVFRWKEVDARWSPQHVPYWRRERTSLV